MKTPDHNSSGKLETFIVGNWRTVIQSGNIHAYRAYSFFSNGVFIRNFGGTASTKTPLNNTLTVKFVHSQMAEGEYGTYRIQGDSLILTWADDGTVETKRISIVSGENTGTQDDDYLRMGARSIYEKVGSPEGTSDIPRGAPHIQVRIRTTDRSYSPPIFTADPSLLNQFQGLQLKLRSFSSYHADIQLNPKSWLMLYNAVNREIPLIYLPSFHIIVTQRCGVYSVDSLDINKKAVSGSVILTGIKPTSDPSRYLISMRFKNVRLYRYNKSHKYPWIIVDIDFTDIPVGPVKS